ncbi:chondroitin AC/alginate lyase [Ilyonectria robusta]|uniref:chondroitin AC/alginate lyase n=1 Tax=Ilyonectria robusta TaxID=1079257 RepID=UPI001E8ECAF4|nr:chondroitin AC/alginate lyase [Ilyonectria robusta]KAH8661729.1 chondroitin AC/alginate lyase [Ilyonectria robusta]
MRAFNTLSFLWVLPTVFAFSHPGLLVTDQDIARAKTKIAAEKEPWIGSWNKLISLEFSSASYTNNAVSSIARAENGELLWHDAAAAFNLALRWKISGNDSYAAAASDILVAWASKLQALTGGGDDDYLTAGLQGYELANAAELLRDYAPFADNGLSAVTSMMTTIFLPMSVDFLNHILGSEHNVKHFFANWELCNVASAMAIGVLADNQTAWDFAVDYFKNGVGNGAIGNTITNIVEEPGTGKPLGQGQESGRDQGHSSLNFQLLGAIGQQAWNQGEDLFAYNNSQYFARYNLGYDVPFEPYTNGIVSYTTISSASRGAIRPNWELLYAHYVQIKGLDAPWTTEYLNNTLSFFGGFEGGAGSWGEGSGHYDGLGWGSLLYHLDESDLDTLPSVPSAIETSTAVSSTAVSSISTSAAPSTALPNVSTLSAADATSSTSSIALGTATPTTPSVGVQSSLPSTTELSMPVTGKPQTEHSRTGKGCPARKGRKHRHQKIRRHI